MTRGRLLWRSLIHHRRMFAAVGAGAAVACAVLIGALLVGDSVRHTLVQRALARVGQVRVALVAGDRFFDDDLGRRLDENSGSDTAAVIVASATAARPDGRARVHGSWVLGVDAGFWTLAPEPTQPALGPGEVVINTHAQRELGIRVGEDLVVRLDRLGGLSRDAALGGEDDYAVLRLRLAGVVDAAHFGDFALHATPHPTINLFVHRDVLARALGKPGKANLLLSRHAGMTDRLRPAAAESALRLSDLELTLRTTPGGETELVSDRVFLDREVARAVETVGQPALGVLTYFVNSLRHGDRTTPYSMVSAVSGNHPMMTGVRDDQIVINRWLAEDLRVREGDAITLRYFVMDSGQRLVERSSAFTVARVVPMTGLAADATLMPAFPGLHDAEDCRDWKPGVPIALEAIRPQDEAYWDAYRGTPKAFVTLAAGQRMWANRFGSHTAIRWDAAVDRATLETGLLRAMSPSAMGLAWQDVRAQAMAAATQGTDFASLFLGLSSFLLASALLLSGLLLAFALDGRASEAGLLLATGWTLPRVRSQFALEAWMVSGLAALVGVGLGVGFTAAVVGLLNTLWRGAVGGTAIELGWSWSTLAGGWAASLAATGVALAWTVRRWGRVHAVDLLAGEAWSSPASGGGSVRAWGWAGLAGVAAMALIVVGRQGGLGSGGQAQAHAFFASGACLLLGGVAAMTALLRMKRGRGSTLTRFGLAWRGIARRPGRSLAVSGLLAAGLFLVLSVGATQLQLPPDPAQRASGTGGFAWYGQLSLPLLQDLNAPAGREHWGLTEDDLRGVSVVRLRVSRGDDASCLSLTRAQQPRVMGVDPQALAQRGSFTFVGGDGRGWLALQDEPGESVPAVADRNTLLWGLGAGLGDVISMVDERGQPLKLRIVGVIDNSILQGGLIVAESVFVERFPSVAGGQVLLVDAPASRGDEVAATLTRALEDLGASFTPTARRLAHFNAVENTYRGIFQALGALGLLLGGAAVGAVVLRNVLERRPELAVLRATGFTAAEVRRLVTLEHALLAGSGLWIGTMAAAAPAGRDLVGPVAGGIVLVVLGAMMSWVALAARLALRGPILDALRRE